jgi:hypothetical protein
VDTALDDVGLAGWPAVSLEVVIGVEHQYPVTDLVAPVNHLGAVDLVETLDLGDREWPVLGLRRRRRARHALAAVSCSLASHSRLALSSS